MTLDELPINAKARIASVDWSSLDEREMRRLRELGFEEGADVTVRHRGMLLWYDPIAVSIGRMTIALRKAHAAHIQVEIA